MDTPMFLFELAKLIALVVVCATFTYGFIRLLDFIGLLIERTREEKWERLEYQRIVEAKEKIERVFCDQGLDQILKAEGINENSD